MDSTPNVVGIAARAARSEPKSYPIWLSFRVTAVAGTNGHADPAR